jgi:hypothetical protein
VRGCIYLKIFINYIKMSWVQRSKLSNGGDMMGSFALASSSDGTKLVAVNRATDATSSGIYTSSDSGVTWTKTNAPAISYGYPYSSGTRWQRVASSSDGKNLVAVINGSIGPTTGIWTSSDYGVNWTKTSAPAANWSSVASSSNGKNLVAAQSGSSGRIYTSTDYGVTWTKRSDTNGTPASTRWTRVASDEDGKNLVAVSSNTNTSKPTGIWTSTDYGVNWTRSNGINGTNAAPAADWSGISSSSDGKNLVAVIDNGIPSGIYTSSDYGVSWTNQPNTQAIHWISVDSSSNGKNLVAASDGIWTSSDYGVSWTKSNAPDALWNNVASSSDGTKLVAAINNLTYSERKEFYTPGTFGIWTLIETPQTPPVTTENNPICVMQ